MVVKFADTQKEKEQKKVQQLQTNLWNLSGINPSTTVLATGNPQYLAVRYFIIGSNLPCIPIPSICHICVKFFPYLIQAIQQVQALNGLQATGSTINQVATPALSVSAPSIITTLASPHPNSAVSPSPVTAFQGKSVNANMIYLAIDKYYFKTR